MEAPARGDEDRQCDQRDRGELRRQEEQCADREDDLQGAADDLDERLAHELVERLHVGSQPRHEDAGALAFEEPERQRLELVECRDAQRIEKALTGGRGKERLRADDERLQQDEHEEDQRRHVQRMRRVLADARVHRVAHEEWARERDQRREGHGSCGDRIARAHRPHEPSHLTPDGPRGRPLHHATASSASSSR